MDLHGKKIILGSNSPRRRELMSGLNIDFTVDTGNNFEESFSKDTPFSEVPVLMSEGKSLGFHRPLEEDEILITADTMVILPPSPGFPGEILGKPRSAEDAVRMLRDLSGKDHQVTTAVTIRDLSRMETFSDTTTVTFKQLTDGEIDYYIREFSPMDKAGAYGVQEWIGYIGITRIEGSYFNVVGLPIHKVYGHLLGFIS